MHCFVEGGNVLFVGVDVGMRKVSDFLILINI